MEEHQIVFRGEVKPGLDSGEVKQKFGSLFKVDNEEKLDKFFSGKAVTIKKNLSSEQALKFQEGLGKIGVVCEISPAIETESATIEPVAAPAIPDFGLVEIDKPKVSGKAVFGVAEDDKLTEDATEVEPEEAEEDDGLGLQLSPQDD